MISTRRRSTWLALTLALAAGSAACGDSKQKDDDGNGSEDGDASSNGRADAQAGGDAGTGAEDGGTVGDSDGALIGDGAAGDAGPMGNASPEVCDGVDNDLDGITDDVDAESDGVCDCLNIATIGAIGPWSNGGNVFKTWLDSRSPMPATELGDQVLTDELLRPFQVIVVLYTATSELNGNGRILPPHHAFSADEIAAFGRWVRNGGGVMTTAGYLGDEALEVVNVNSLLGPLGAGYSTSKLDVGGMITNWTAHPLTDEVARIRINNGVEPDGAQAMSIAFDSASRVALQVTQADQGRVAVWGDEWMTYDSEWEDSQDQQVSRFWLNILKWLSPAKVCQVALPPLL